ncbi:MAG: GNAT family N-acetyltransferase [Eubacterium sp.]|nr:GNAT family N-acetyltransferase [Eubacterium sp.]
MDKEIVKITLDDYYKCSNIWDMKNSPHTENFINQIKAGNRMVYVYKINNEFIGEGNLVIKSDEKDYTIPNKRVYLSHLIVKKEFRNQGIGAEILDFLIETAKKLGYSEISLGVDCGNDTAVHIYRKKGFEIFFIGKDEQGEYYKMQKSI